MVKKVFHEFTEDQLETLKRQLKEKKQEQHDDGVQIKEIDLYVNELLDVQIRKKKKELKALRYDLTQQQYNNAMSIAELERSIYQKGYYQTEEEKNGS